MVRRVRKIQIRTRWRRRQRGGFLNRYDFACAGRDTVNTAMKNAERIAPELMKQFSNQVNQVVQQRIQQIIDQGEQKVEKVAPKIQPLSTNDPFWKRPEDVDFKIQAM